MREALLEAGILIPLLLFEIWNVCTAKRRGQVFLKLRPIVKRVEPNDFRVALMLNAVFVGVILLVIVLRGYHFLDAATREKSGEVKTANSLDHLVGKHIQLDGVLVGDKYLWIVTTNARVELNGNLSDAQRLISNHIVVEGILGKDQPFTTPSIDELKPGPWGPNQPVLGGYVLHKAKIISSR